MLAPSLRRALAPIVSSKSLPAWLNATASTLQARSAAQFPRHLTASARRSGPNDVPGQSAELGRYTPLQGRSAWHFVDHLPSALMQERHVTPEEKWRQLSARAQKSTEAVHDAYYGRSVAVTGRDTVANAYRKLSSVISRNNVRKELRMGERHEKKGPKRRRLSSERWRRRFAHEVRKKVQLVQAIRARGG